MRWPWTQRTRQREAEAWERAQEADRQLTEVRERWAEPVQRVTNTARAHRELNGWNNIARALIDGGSR